MNNIVSPDTHDWLTHLRLDQTDAFREVKDDRETNEENITNKTFIEIQSWNFEEFVLILFLPKLQIAYLALGHDLWAHTGETEEIRSSALLVL